jgi:YD repeat-containing protein
MLVSDGSDSSGGANPNGSASTFDYDDMGRVKSEQMPSGCSWTLDRQDPGPENPSTPVKVTVTSAEGRTRGYTTGKDATGAETRTNVSSDGLTTTTKRTQAGVDTKTSPDGMTNTVTSRPGPRAGLSYRISSSSSARTGRGDQRGEERRTKGHSPRLPLWRLRTSSRATPTTRSGVSPALDG